MSTTLQDIKALSITELANLPATTLLPLQQAAATAYAQAQATKHWVDGAIALKYREQAKDLRLQLGKDTGVIHFQDEGVQVTVNLPKKPQWDQTQLATIARRMWLSGENPSELLDIRYGISERKYQAWTAPLQEDFASARTVAVGKETYLLANPGEGTL